LHGKQQISGARQNLTRRVRETEKASPDNNFHAAFSHRIPLVSGFFPINDVVAAAIREISS
jgi:hypothetical protein